MSTEMTKEQKALLREKKRRRLRLRRRIGLGIILCVILAFVLFLLFTFLFKVDTVEVTGKTDSEGNISSYSTYYTSDEIISASGIDTGDSLVLMSVSGVAERIVRTLPYIGSVTVEKHYPGGVTLVIEETEDFYAIEVGNSYVVLDRSFKVLGTYESVPEGCAVLDGITLSQAVTGETAVFDDEAYKDRIETVADSCEANGITDVTAYDFSNLAAVKIIIGGKATVNLGTITDIDEKLVMAAKTIEAELTENGNEFIIVDVSDKERAYVRDDNDAKNSYEEPETEEETEDDESDFDV
ncbi:MAG: FtsQ-type POTRA domain-containing protein [Clostridiales bacterium]|nr:FtsQ-type POTRA domain-containing protein [Clostridiales bacterium]